MFKAIKESPEQNKNPGTVGLTDILLLPNKRQTKKENTFFICTLALEQTLIRFASSPPSHVCWVVMKSGGGAAPGLRERLSRGQSMTATSRAGTGGPTVPFALDWKVSWDWRRLVLKPGEVQANWDDWSPSRDAGSCRSGSWESPNRPRLYHPNLSGKSGLLYLAWSHRHLYGL